MSCVIFRALKMVVIADYVITVKSLSPERVNPYLGSTSRDSESREKLMVEKGWNDRGGTKSEEKKVE